MFDGNIYWSDLLDAPITPKNADKAGEIRLRNECPYSYSPILRYQAEGDPKGQTTTYHDRMMQWDYDKYGDSAEAAGFNPPRKQMGLERESPETLEKFLRIYFDDDSIKLIRMIEYCNMSSGYPIYRFDYISG
jgi:hypothetical protein